MHRLFTKNSRLKNRLKAKNSNQFKASGNFMKTVIHRRNLLFIHSRRRVDFVSECHRAKLVFAGADFSVRSHRDFGLLREVWKVSRHPFVARKILRSMPARRTHRVARFQCRQLGDYCARHRRTDNEYRNNRHPSAHAPAAGGCQIHLPDSKSGK